MQSLQRRKEELTGRLTQDETAGKELTHLINIKKQEAETTNERFEAANELLQDQKQIYDDQKITTDRLRETLLELNRQQKIRQGNLFQLKKSLELAQMQLRFVQAGTRPNGFTNIVANRRTFAV